MASRDSVGAAECPLCLSVYEDPRVLPVCGHSFCLKCIKKSAKSNSLGVVCPICRKLSSVTSGGFEGLPINYALISLLLNLSSERTKDPGANANTVLCLKHEGEEMVIVCIDCWTPICIRCYEEAHSKHHTSSVRKFVADTIKKFQSDGKEIDLKLSQVESQKDKLESNKTEFLNQITEQEVAINEEYASLKLLLEQGRNKLVEELMAIKHSVLKCIEQCIQEFEFQCQELRSLNTRIHELTKLTGAQVNMAAVGQLKEIKERLNNATNTKIKLKGSKSVVTFLPTDFWGLIKKSSAYENPNIIGRLQLNPISKQRKLDKCEEEPFDSAEFTIQPKYFTSRYDMEEKLKKFASDVAFVVNPDKSVTLFPDRFIDGLNAVKLICESKQDIE